MDHLIQLIQNRLKRQKEAFERTQAELAQALRVRDAAEAAQSQKTK